MAFGGFDKNAGRQAAPEINMVPLIDVMLVLLIIFMVTAPMLTNAVKIDLPKADSLAQAQDTPHVELAIDAEGRLFWNAAAASRDALRENLRKMAAQSPQPELHVRADQNVPYRAVAEALADAAKAGVTRIGFVSEPAPEARND